MNLSVLLLPLARMSSGSVLASVSSVGPTTLATTASFVSEERHCSARICDALASRVRVRRHLSGDCALLTDHTVDGAFAEYCAYHKSKVVPIQNMTDMEACLVEPASCAAQMLNKVAPSVGSTVLVFGSGPAGLLIAQLFKQNGGCKVVIAALAGAKLDLGRTLQAGDEFVEVGGTTPDAALEELKKRYSHGFDIVVEASGVPKVLENSINFVRRGGKLAIFGVYSSAARVSWSPSKILGDQISIVGSIAEVIRFPVSVDYIESGRVNVKGIANRTFKLEQWGEALESMRQADTVKAAIVFDD